MVDQFKGPPVRLRLQRTAGFKLQALSIATNGRAAINCARPGPYGNPFVVTPETTAERCVIHFRAELLRNGWICGPRRTVRMPEIIEKLRGRNLACFCRLDAPHCHVDVLLKVVNS